MKYIVLRHGVNAQNANKTRKSKKDKEANRFFYRLSHLFDNFADARLEAVKEYIGLSYGVCTDDDAVWDIIKKQNAEELRELIEEFTRWKRKAYSFTSEVGEIVIAEVAEYEDGVPF